MGTKVTQKTPGCSMCFCRCVIQMNFQEPFRDIQASTYPDNVPGHA